MDKSSKKSRFEIKYHITLSDGIDFINSLNNFMRLDSNVNKNNRYTVRSLYYDTTFLNDYTDTLKGEMVRKKIRLRNYRSSENIVALEVKHKHSKVIAKDRIFIPIKDAVELINSPFDEKFSMYDEFRYYFARNKYIPCISVIYERIPLVDLLGGDIRVTLDYNLRCGKSELFYREARVSDLRVLPPGEAILEVKFNKYMPVWLSRYLKQFNLVQTTYSKYARSMDRLYGETILITEVQKKYGSIII